MNPLNKEKLIDTLENAAYRRYHVNKLVKAHNKQGRYKDSKIDFNDGVITISGIKNRKDIIIKLQHLEKENHWTSTSIARIKYEWKGKKFRQNYKNNLGKIVNEMLQETKSIEVKYREKSSSEESPIKQNSDSISSTTQECQESSSSSIADSHSQGRSYFFFQDEERRARTRELISKMHHQKVPDPEVKIDQNPAFSQDSQTSSSTSDEEVCFSSSTSEEKLCFSPIESQTTREEKSSIMDIKRSDLLSLIWRFYIYDIEIHSDIQKYMTVLPIFSEKDFYMSIFKKSDFYKKTICPAMKFLAILVSSRTQEPTTFYKKWQTGLEKLANLWVKADGQSFVRRPPDSNTMFYDLLELFRGLNLVFKSLAVAKVNTESFFRNLHLVKVSLVVPKNGILSSLSYGEQSTIIQDYIENPKKNAQLNRLFRSDTVFQNWPAECQFLLASVLINIEKQVWLSEVDPAHRQGTIAVLDNILKFKNRSILAKRVHKLACNDSWLGAKAFDLSLKGASVILKKRGMEPELTIAQRIQHPYSKKVIDFLSTPARIEFDTALCSFINSCKNDVIDAVLSKHSTDAKELETNPNKELNLQDILIRDSKMAKLSKRYYRLLKDYLEEIHNNSESPLKEEKKAMVTEAQNEMVLAFFHSMQSYSSLLISQPHYLKFLQTVDASLLPSSTASQGVTDWVTSAFFPSLNKLC